MIHDLRPLIKQLKFNYSYLVDLVNDVEEDLMTHLPAKGLENHPAFTIGHLVTAYGLTTKHLGGPYTVKKEWDDLFRRKGPGDPRYPSLNQQLYPSKLELLQELQIQHEKLLLFLESVSQEQLNREVKWRYDEYFPTSLDLIYFMCLTHYAMHISQLAAWRRAVNLPSSLARL